ncbi:MAG TPA: glutamine cyclotransferase [Planctomycetaceae bacterium]|nr:glutamine cyclotransferase [Blastopirellula sp.]HAY82112.1 glutamine cyclotransferase [Planctomycetaceae bacterium]
MDHVKCQQVANRSERKQPGCSTVFDDGKDVARRRARTRVQPKRDSTGRLTTCAFILSILAALAAIGLTSGSFDSGNSRSRDESGYESDPPVSDSETPSSSSGSPNTYSYEVVNTYPHDRHAFSQGLDFDGKTLFESTGKYGRSTVRRVNLETGKVEKQLQLDPRLFGEGLTLCNDKVIQLTWRHRLGYVYDAKTLKPLRTFRYDGEGWGLTYDGDHLIMSDGSDKLRFLDPISFAHVRTIRVKDGVRSVRDLNELEFVNGEVLANIWHSDRIAMISPETGKVTGWIDLSGLLSKPLGPESVLNGIAYEDGRLFVTGKNWPQLFEIELVKKSRK